MSIENSNTNSSSIGSYLLMPGIVYGGGAVKSLVKNRGIKGALNIQNHELFKGFDAKLKTTDSLDIFQRSQVVSENYSVYKNLAAKNRDLQRKAKNWDNKFHLFNKSSKADIEKLASQASEALSGAQGTIKSGKQLDIAIDSVKTVKKAKTTAGGFLSTAGKYFKNEFNFKKGGGGWFNVIMSAVSFVPNVFTKVVPAFKEGGAKEGFKELGKVGVQLGTDLVGYAAGGAIGRTIGGAIGTLICPGAGTAIGAGLGDMIGSMFVGSKICKVVDKIIGADENTQANPNKQNVLAYEQSAQDETTTSHLSELQSKISQIQQEQAPIDIDASNKVYPNSTNATIPLNNTRPTLPNGQIARFDASVNRINRFA